MKRCICWVVIECGPWGLRTPLGRPSGLVRSLPRPAVHLQAGSMPAQAHSSLCTCVPWDCPLESCAIVGSYKKAIYRATSTSLFLCKCKTPHASKIYSFILSNLMCLGNSYINFKRNMCLGIQIHQHMCTKKNIGVMFIGL